MTKNLISIIHRTCLYVSGACFLGLLGCWIAKYPAACGPLVRSSYHADQQAQAALEKVAGA